MKQTCPANNPSLLKVGLNERFGFRSVQPNHPMKKTLLLVSLTWAVFQTCVAETAWLTDLPAAQKQARTENKMVLIDFTGSDWCPPCKALHKNVLTSPEFTAFAKTSLVLVELDFPNSKKQSSELKAANKKLSADYKIEGYPTLIVLDAAGKEVFRKVGYDGTAAKGYVADLAKLKK